VSTSRSVTTHQYSKHTLWLDRNWTTFLSFPLLMGDCGRSGWYDCPQSALRPCTVWPNAPATPDVCKLVCEWVCVTPPEAGVYCVGGTLLPYVSSAWRRPFRFTRHRPSVCHAHSYRAAQGSTRPSQQGHAAAWCMQCLSWCTWPNTYQCQQSALITTQVPLFLSVMACHSLKSTQANSLYLSENLIP